MELQPELTCILHVENVDSYSAVKQCWKKVTETLAAGKKWLKQIKHDELPISFPENHHHTFGYHSICCKNFTAFPKVLSNNFSSTEASDQRANQMPERIVI